MKVEISEEVYRKVLYWVDRAKNQEVSGLGTILLDRETNTMRVVSAMLLPQKNQSTHTEIEAAAVAKAMFELRDAPGELKWWWHSHVQMGVFWSGTDKDTIKEWGDNGWVLATVFNQKREKRSAFYSRDGMITPLGQSSLFLDEIPTEVGGANEYTKLWEKEYLDNVENYKPPVKSLIYPPGYMGAHVGGGGSDFMEAGKRPAGMSKKTWKAIRKAARPPAHKPPGVAPQLVHDARVPTYDEYGFDQDERTLLAQEGFDLSSIDYLVEEDFSPLQIITLAMAGYNPIDVENMMEEGQTPEQIVQCAKNLIAFYNDKGYSAVSDDAPIDEEDLEDNHGGSHAI